MSASQTQESYFERAGVIRTQSYGCQTVNVDAVSGANFAFHTSINAVKMRTWAGQRKKQKKQKRENLTIQTGPVYRRRGGMAVISLPRWYYRIRRLSEFWMPEYLQNRDDRYFNWWKMWILCGGKLCCGYGFRCNIWLKGIFSDIKCDEAAKREKRVRKHRMIPKNRHTSNIRSSYVWSSCM